MLISGLLSGICARADDPAADKEKQRPRVAMCAPLAVAVGSTTKIIARGWLLDGVQQVRSTNPRLALKILSTSQANVPNGQDAKQIGDTQVELEVAVAEGVEPGEVKLVMVAPTGESQPHALLVGGVHASVAEKESNDGFRQAQEIQIPQIVDGQIHSDRNVDVFSFTIADKQHVSIEVLARRHGSGLDSLLTLFGEQGNIVDVSDDHDGQADSRISALLPAGTYFISLQDAHDHGGPAHPYRLVVRLLP